MSLKEATEQFQRGYITAGLSRLDAAGYPTRLFFKIWPKGVADVPAKDLIGCANLVDRSIVDARNKGYAVDAEEKSDDT